MTTQIQLLEIIFASKNKEYGSYVLRKLYNKYVSIATIIAIVFFVLATSTPLIIKYLFPEEVVAKKKLRMIDYTQLSEPPSIDKKEIQQIVEAPPPLKSTIKFLPPIVKPDDQVTEEYVPTVDELKEVDPGAKTQEGNPEGVDYSLLDIENNEIVEEPEKEVREEVFTFVEEMPSYPGGNDALMSYFQSNIVYPEIAKRAGVQGKVFVSFIVRRDGSIYNVEVVKGIGAGCDEEAVRVIRMMSSWSPGKQNGSPVQVKVSVPIYFKLQG